MTREPTPEGLDGGRLQQFELHRYGTPLVANNDKYPVRHSVLLARYINGKLTRFGHDPRTGELIEQIKRPVADDDLRWRGLHWAGESVRRDDAVHCCLKRVAQVLDDLVVERPLSPGAETARDMCHAALDTIERPDKPLASAIAKAARQEAARGQDREADRER